MDTHKRSITKALTWRFLALLTTWLIAWLITGSIYAGLSIGIADSTIKLVIYYIHERQWQKIKWGLKPVILVETGGGI